MKEVVYTWPCDQMLTCAIACRRRNAKFVSEEYDASFAFSVGYTKQDGTVVPAGAGRTEVDTMDHYVKGIITPMNN